MVPEVRVAEVAFGSAVIFPRLSKATPPVSIFPPAPVMTRLAPSVRAEPSVLNRPLPGWLPNRMVPGLPTAPLMTWAPPTKNSRLRAKLFASPRRTMPPGNDNPPETMTSAVAGCMSSVPRIVTEANPPEKPVIVVPASTFALAKVPP